MNVLLVGCGKMGSALKARWQELSLCSALEVIDPVATGAHASVSALPEDFHPDAVVIAVKPQSLPAILADYVPFAEDGAYFLSIAAGKTILSFEDALGASAKVIRAMPNTPAEIGAGVTVAVANKNISPYEKESATKLLGAVGDVLWVNNEELMNPVTALSGSGPAYVFLLIEAMTASGVKAGLDPVTAEKLARQTVIGSALLAKENADMPAAILRQNVTSPGGTTEAALKVLMAENGLEKLMIEAIIAATRRAGQLAS